MAKAHKIHFTEIIWKGNKTPLLYIHFLDCLCLYMLLNKGVFFFMQFTLFWSLCLIILLTDGPWDFWVWFNLLQRDMLTWCLIWAWTPSSLHTYAVLKPRFWFRSISIRSLLKFASTVHFLVVSPVWFCIMLLSPQTPKYGLLLYLLKNSANASFFPKSWRPWVGVLLQPPRG